MAIETVTIQPFPDGMNTQDEAWAIEDTQARFLQDVVLDKPGIARRRGPVINGASASSFFDTTIADMSIGIVSAIDPTDTFRIGLLHGTATSGSAKLGVLLAGYGTHQDVDWGAAGHANTFDPTKRYKYATSPHPWGGTLIGTQINGPNPGGANTTLGHWYGATKAEVSAGTITVAQDATAVTGVGTTFTSIDPGTFLYAIADTDSTPSNGARTFIGTVKNVNSTTSLDLMEGALFAVTARAYRLRPTRPVSRRVAKGQITTTTTSPTVQGANTKFKRQKLDTPSNNGHWCIFRADDMKFIGKVSSVASDIQLTLTANANIVCNKDKYVAIDMYDNRDLNTNTSNDPGWLTAQFAGRMWYGNRPAGTSNRSQPYPIARVWFSDIFDPEALDVTSDGDHILIPSDSPPIKPLTAMAPTTNALVCFKEDETYGVFGTDETNFAVRKILDDGAFDAMCVCSWNGGLVWAGQKGIYFFDGSEEPFNIIEDRILKYYRQSVEGHKNITYRAWAFIHKDQYVINIEGATPPFGPVLNAGATADDAGRPTSYLQLYINLNTRAVSTWTNVSHRGAVHAPFEEGIGSIYLYNRIGINNPWTPVGTRLGQASTLLGFYGYDTALTETVTPANNRLGPSLYIESKRFDVNDPQRKKNFKQIQMLNKIDTYKGTHFDATAYITTGDTTGSDYIENFVNFSTVKGLNEFATISSSKWRLQRDTTSGVGVPSFGNKRIKFLKRSQHLGFRIFEERPGFRFYGVTAIDGTYSPIVLTADVKCVSKITGNLSNDKLPALNVYLDGNGGGVGSQVLKGVIYTDTAGLPDRLIATTNEVTVVQGQAAKFVRFPFNLPPDLESGKSYWIGIHRGATANVARIWSSTTAAAQITLADTYSDGATDPFGAGSTTTGPLAVYAEHYQHLARVEIGPLALGYKWLRAGRV